MGRHRHASAVPLRGKQPVRDPESGNQEDCRPEDPHKCPGGCLVIQRAHAQRIGLHNVAGINWTSGKAEESRQAGIHNVRRKNVGNQHPAQFFLAGRPWPQNRPPEQDAGEEKAGVLQVVPVL